MAGENYVLEGVTHALIEAGITADSAGLALSIMRTIHAGDDIGNGLRAVPIEALNELKPSLNQDAHQLGRSTGSQQWPASSCRCSAT